MKKEKNQKGYPEGRGRRLLALLLCACMLGTAAPAQAHTQTVVYAAENSGAAEQTPDTAAGEATSTGAAAGEATPATPASAAAGEATPATPTGAATGEATPATPTGAAAGEATPATPTGAATDEAVGAVQAMVDALPTLEQVTADDYAAVQAAYDAYEALTQAQQAQITGAGRFEELFGWFNTQTESAGTSLPSTGQASYYLDKNGTPQTYDAKVYEDNICPDNVVYAIPNSGVTTVSVGNNVIFVLNDNDNWPYSIETIKSKDETANGSLGIYAGAELNAEQQQEPAANIHGTGTLSIGTIQNVTVTLYGGTYTSLPESGWKLGEGHCFRTGGEGGYSYSTTFTSGAQVVKCTGNHTWSKTNLKCNVCGATCPHKNADGSSAIEIIEEILACSVCGQTIVTSVTVDDTTSYYAAFDAALAAANAATGTVTLTLLANLENDVYYYYKSYTVSNSMTVDLNGKTLGLNCGYFYISGSGVKVTMQDTATTTQGHLNGDFNVNDGAKVTITGGVFSKLTVENADAELRGGTFDQGVVNSGKDVYDLLADGYAYKNSDGWYQKGTDNRIDSYCTVVPEPFAMTISDASNLSHQDADLRYGDNFEIVVTVTQTSTSENTVSYQWYEVTDAGTTDFTADAMEPSCLDNRLNLNFSPDAGTHTYGCTVTVDEYSISKEVTVTIGKATINFDLSQYCTSSENTYTYNGKAQNLLQNVPDISGQYSGSTTYYRIGTDGEWTTDWNGVTVKDVPQETDAGNGDAFTLYYYVDGGTNYNSIGSKEEPSCVNFTFKPYEVTITPNSGQKKTYGSGDPELHYAYNKQGEMNDDLLTSFEENKTGKLGRTEGENAGSYDYTLGTLRAGRNFKLVLDTSAGSSAGGIGEEKNQFVIEPKSLSSVTNLPTQKIYAVHGVGAFTDPDMQALIGEEVTGTYKYSDATYDTHEKLVEKFEKIGISSVSVWTCDYVLTGTGNYKDTASVRVDFYVQPLNFTVNGDTASASNAVELSTVYGTPWNELVKVKDTLTAKVGETTVAGTYTVKFDGASASDAENPSEEESSSRHPKVGEHSYQVLFTSADGSIQDRKVFSGTVTVTKKTLQAVVRCGDYYYSPDSSIVSLNYIGVSGTLKNDAWYVDSVNSYGTVTEKTVGVNSPVEVTIVLSGTDASNYTVQPPTGLTVTVRKCPIYVAQIASYLKFAVENKTYDGTTAAVVITEETQAPYFEGGQYTSEYSELVYGTDYTLTATFDTANAGENKTVTAVMTLLDSERAKNYELVEGATTVITTATVTTTATIYQAEMNLPVGLKGTAGEKLSTVALPEGFAWDTPDEVLSVSKSSYQASYIDKNGNYKTITSADVPVTVERVQKALAVTMEGWAYGSTPKRPQYITNDGIEANSLTVTYKDAKGGTVQEVTSCTVPGTYTVEVSYQTATEVWSGSTTFEVSKATPTICFLGAEITQPPIASVSYKQEVADAHIQAEAHLVSEYNTSSSVPGKFTWQNVTSYGEASDEAKTFYATFTPDESDLYNVVENIAVSVTVNKLNYAAAPKKITQNYFYGNSYDVDIDLSAYVPADGGTTTYDVILKGEMGFTKQPSMGEDKHLRYTIAAAETSGKSANINVFVSTQNYHKYQITVSVTQIPELKVQLKEGYTVSLPEESSITYGTPLKNLAFNEAVFVDENGTVVEGTLSWKEPDSYPDASVTSAEWQFVPTNNEYETLSGWLEITVYPLQLQISENPSIADMTYHPTRYLSKDDLLGGIVIADIPDSLSYDKQVSGTWELDEDPYIPQCGENMISVKFTPEDSNKFASLPKVYEEGIKEPLNVYFDVYKAIPYISEAPTVELVYGSTLASATLSSKVYYSETETDISIEGNFAWKNIGLLKPSEIKPTVADSKENNATRYTVVFTPTDTGRYEPVELEITITVKPAELTTLPQETMNVKNSCETVGDVMLPDGWAWADADAEKALTVGTTVKATAVYAGADKGNYKNESVTVSITRSACEHTGGTATCKEQAKCSLCGEPYGELDLTKHTGGTEVRGKIEAKCTEAGYTGDTYCKDCNQLLVSGTTVNALGHIDKNKDNICDRENCKATLTTSPTTTPSPSEPTTTPSPSEPTLTPSPSEPTTTPSPSEPTPTPTMTPSPSEPTTTPTMTPSPSEPTITPTLTPSPSNPTAKPTMTPSPSNPTAKPTMTPSPSEPTMTPSPSEPTTKPTMTPSPSNPTAKPTMTPSPSNPTAKPTMTPSPSNPTAKPTMTPSPSNPTAKPTMTPSPSEPTATPTPSSAPTKNPGMSYKPETEWASSDAFRDMENAYEVLLGTSAKTTSIIGTLNVGDTIDLNFYGVKNWTKGAYTYRWISSDESVATVDNLGNVTMHSEGIAIIRLELVEKATGRKLSVAPMFVGTPESSYHVFLGTSAKDAKTVWELPLGSQIDLNFYGVKNWKKENYEYFWTSSDEDIATVNNKGVVTTKKSGTVLISLKIKEVKTGEYLKVAPAVITIPEKQ